MIQTCHTDLKNWNTFNPKFIIIDKKKIKF